MGRVTVFRARGNGSRCLLMVVAQEPAEPLSTLNRSRSRCFGDPGKQQHIAFPLMISFSMIMVDVSV